MLTSRTWLAGRGGTGFDLTIDPADPERLHHLQPEQRDQLRALAYRQVIAVSTQARAGVVLVDPQGHDYARYAAHVLPTGLSDRQPDLVEDIDEPPTYQQPALLNDALL